MSKPPEPPREPGRVTQHSSVARRVLLAISIAIAIAGFIAFFTPLGTLGIYILALAGIPAGLALGTQEKDYFL